MTEHVTHRRRAFADKKSILRLNYHKLGLLTVQQYVNSFFFIVQRRNSLLRFCLLLGVAGE